MSTKIPVKTASGDVFFVEASVEPDVVASTGPDPSADLIPRGAALRGPTDKVLDETVFSKAVGVIRSLAQDVGTGLMHTDPMPSRVELEFSLGISAGGTVVVFKGEANAVFRLKLTWGPPTSEREDTR